MYEPNKSLGQNFLIDKDVTMTMVDALNIADGELLIEIGAGLGVLTDEIAVRIRDTKTHLIGVEIDPRFIPRLEEMYKLDPNITIICDNILVWFPEFSAEREYKVIGSLPYNITSPILHMMIKVMRSPKVCVFMLQKEVAEKVCAKVPDASYLSSFIQTYYNVSLVADVPRNRFSPQPNVDSAIIKMVHKDVDYSHEFTERYEKFLHRGFSHPRKMLNKAFSKKELSTVNIDPSLRAQNLDTEAWVNFFNTVRQDAI